MVQMWGCSEIWGAQIGNLCNSYSVKSFKCVSFLESSETL